VNLRFLHGPPFPFIFLLFSFKNSYFWGKHEVNKGKIMEGVSSTEYKHPSFSVNLHDKDGDPYCEGIYLHYGDTIIKVASSLSGFKAHAEYLASMVDEIEENIALY
jgi:hypothetical protein